MAAKPPSEWLGRLCDSYLEGWMLGAHAAYLAMHQRAMETGEFAMASEIEAIHLRRFEVPVDEPPRRIPGRKRQPGDGLRPAPFIPRGDGRDDDGG